MKKNYILFYLILNQILYAAQRGPIDKYFIQKFLPQNPVILEAGAHTGTDTAEMASLWPSCTIYAFEPEPNLFLQLKDRCKNLSNVHIFELALSDKRGSANFYVSSGTAPSGHVYDASSSLLPPKEHLINHSLCVFNKIIEVETITLDEWAKENNIDKIDFLWLDMQGYEPPMLMASPNILKTVKVIFTEVNLKELYEGCILYPEYKKWLDEQGFVAIREDFKELNVLFVQTN